MTPQFGPSLADNSRVIIYDRNMFIVQSGATEKGFTRVGSEWDKHSSLLRKSVNYDRKKFYWIGPTGLELVKYTLAYYSSVGG